MSSETDKPGENALPTETNPIADNKTPGETEQPKPTVDGNKPEPTSDSKKPAETEPTSDSKKPAETEQPKPIANNKKPAEKVPPKPTVDNKKPGETEPIADGKKPGEKAPPKPTIPFWDLYKYRDSTDTTLMVFGFIGGLANGVALPAFSELWGRLLDELSNTTDMKEVGDNVSKWSALLTYVGIAVFVCSFLEVGLMMYSAERQVRRIRSAYMSSVLTQNIGYFDEHTPGTIGSRLAADTKLMQAGMGEKVTNCVHNGSCMVAGVIFGFIKSWRLTLVVLSILPLLAGCGALMGKMLATLSEKSQESYAAAGSIATQAVENIRTVHAFNAINFEEDRYKAHLAKARSHGVKKGFVTGLTTGVVYFIVFGSYSLAFWYSSTLVRDGINTVGEITACFFAVLMASFSVGMLAAPIADISTARGAAYDIYATLVREPPIDIRKKGKIIENLKGEITFRNVTFEYPTRKDQIILKDFSLEMKSGESVAFVGPSGCGKSSIVGLVERFYDPVGGEILVDGVPLKDIDLKWWRDQIAIVSQEPSLFSGTVMSNVKAGNKNVKDEDVIQACKDAFIHDTISKLPKGYQTEVGSLGSQLSGGQKQRIAIARAIVKNPKILILDEATSALDRRSEIRVQQALDKILEGQKRTTIVIAHRLVTIKDCDVIYVLDPCRLSSNEPIDNEGPINQIAERGNYNALLELGGKFAALVKAQGRSQDQEAQTGEVGTNAIVQVIAQEDDDEINKEEQVTEESKISNEPISWKRLMSLNESEWWANALGFIGAIVGGSVYPFYAVVFSEMLTVLGQKRGKDLDEQGPFWAMLFLVIAGGSLFSYTFQFGFFGYAGEYLTERLRLHLFRALLRNEIAFFDEPGHEPGSLGAILAGDTEAIHSLLGPTIAIKVQSISTLACAFGISFWYSWKLALVCLCSVPAVAIAGVANMMFVGGGFGEKNSDALEKAGKIAHEATSNIRTVAAFNMNEDISSQYAECINEREVAGKRAALGSGFIFAFGQFVMFAAFALAFWYGGKLISDGEKNFNDVMICSMAIMMGSMGIGESSAMAVKYKDAEGSAKKVFHYIDRKPKMDIESVEHGSLEPNMPFGMSFEDVYFYYPTRPTALILKKLNLEIPPKKHVALIGSTGCGKSTCMQLVLRYYDPQLPTNLKLSIGPGASVNPGIFKINGVDARSIGLWWWRSQLAIVSQEPSLFEGSIRDNITYGMKIFSDAEVVEAAKLANLHDDVMDFKDKYNTNVGSKGGKLSGGQKQRVAIARAIIRKPRVLLLDEATSALDNKSEAMVQKAIDNIISTLGMTVITIAHRLSTIECADVIAVLDEGRLIEMGSHKELMALQGDYYDRYQQYHAGSDLASNGTRGKTSIITEGSV